MKKIFVCLLLLSFQSYSQDSLKVKKEYAFHRWQVGINGSADYCYRTLEDAAKTETTKAIIDLRDDNEIPLLGYTTGLSLAYNFSRKTGLELGIQYSHKGFAYKKLDVSDMVFGDMIDPRYGFIYESQDVKGPQSWQSFYNYNYIDIPFRFNFRAGNRRFHFISSAGLTANILYEVSTTTVWEYREVPDERKTSYYNYTDYKNYNLTATLSFGAEYQPGKHLTFRLEPTGRYSLLHVSDTPINFYLWNVGLNVGCYYGLW